MSNMQLGSTQIHEWTDVELVKLLADHSYEQVREMTGCSRGRIYKAACRLKARKNEDRIQQRKTDLQHERAEFMKEVMGTTVKSDVLDYLAGMPDDSVNMFLTSVPYNLGKRYGDGISADGMRFGYFYGWLVQVVSEMGRVLKDGGTLCLQLGQTRDWQNEDRMYPLDVLIFEDLRRAGLQYVTRVVWTFNHGLTPKSRLSERYETMLVFSKGEQRVFNPMPARTPQKQPDKRAFKGPNKGKLSGHWAGAHPSNVWEIAPVGANHPEKTDHPCQFPMKLVRRSILLWSMPGDVVCDPFSGSGSTHQGCIETGRAFTGCDLVYEDTRAERLAKIHPNLVSMLPGITDESSAVWQAEAKPVIAKATPITKTQEKALCESLELF